jgi:hypothetical protein
MSAPHNSPVINSFFYDGYESSSKRSKRNEINDPRIRNSTSHTQSQTINIEQIAKKLLKMSSKNTADISSAPSRKRKFEATISLSPTPPAHSFALTARPAKIPRKLLENENTPGLINPPATNSDAADASSSVRDSTTSSDAAAAIPSVTVTPPSLSSSDTESSDGVASNAESDIEMYNPESIATYITDVPDTGHLNTRSPNGMGSDTYSHDTEAAKAGAAKKNRQKTEASQAGASKKNSLDPNSSKADASKKNSRESKSSTAIASNAQGKETKSSEAVASKKHHSQKNKSSEVVVSNAQSQDFEIYDAVNSESDSETYDFHLDLIRNFEKLSIEKGS